MNGSTSPFRPHLSEAGDRDSKDAATAKPNGNEIHAAAGSDVHERVDSPPSRDKKGDEVSTFAGASVKRTEENASGPQGDDNGVDSEAETLIDSPVKRKEMEKQSHITRPERPLKHRIGSLPVPTDDENDSVVPSPVPSTVMSVEKPTPPQDVKVEQSRLRDETDLGDESDSLSSPRSNPSGLPSRESSLSRAASERPGGTRDGLNSPNPRKRKHRASSVSLPNKRPSNDEPETRIRAPRSEEFGNRSEHSASPNVRSHRRAVSTQSAVLDGGLDMSHRKRRAGTHGPDRDAKVSRTTWEESDASSETTLQGPQDPKRPQRGIGRSTSTPGRPSGRKPKTNKYGFTKLAEACEDGDLELVKEWREKDPDQLEHPEYAGNKPLQIAALKGNVEVVDYLIEQGCQIDCANVDKDTPLIDAAENGHLDVVNSLLNAGVDPLRQNLKGQQALDVVTDDTDDADEIRAALRRAIEEWYNSGAKQRLEEEEESRHRAGPAKELQFMERSYENLIKLVQINDRNGVREFLDARVPVDNVVVALAAKTGDLYLVNMLLVELPEKKARQRPERLLQSVLGTSHFEMVKILTELDYFDPLYQDRSGKTWPELAEEKHGPNWRAEQELLQRLYDQRLLRRRSSSPVTSRDNGKRRLAPRAVHEESDEDEAPRRKNGRKLMSKRELLEARGQAASDLSSDESSSEPGAPMEESAMKPPGGRTAKRTTPARSRTRSFSAQTADLSPRARRASLRTTNESQLPPYSGGSKSHDDVGNRQQAEQEARAEEEARRAAAEQLQKEKAEAEAAAKRAAEEEIVRRQAEEARKAEEARHEAERRAEEARQAAEEEERRIAEEIAAAEAAAAAAAAAAKRAHREQVLSCLPAAVSHVFSPYSGFDYDSPISRGHLVHHFTPLQVTKYEPTANEGDLALWVVNVQAAPLLGEQGIELLLRTDIPGYTGSLADTWETHDIFTSEISAVQSMLASLPQNLPIETRTSSDSDLSFDQELVRISQRVHAAAEAKTKLRTGDAVLRLVRLEDVLSNLHPSLTDTKLEVRFDFVEVRKNVFDAEGEGEEDGKEGLFVNRLGGCFEATPRPRTYVNGKLLEAQSHAKATGTTRVSVVYDK